MFYNDLDNKANKNHTHSGYASSTHNHDDTYFKTTGGSVSGNLTVLGNESILGWLSIGSEGKIMFNEDSEGGNITLKSKSNTHLTEMDMYNDTTFRMYHQRISDNAILGMIKHSINNTVDLDMLSGVTTNIQTQIDAIYSKFAVITGTTSGTKGGNVYLNLPTGFTVDNTIIIGYRIGTNNSTPLVTNGFSDRVQIGITVSNKIYLYTNHDSLTNCAVAIFLAKVDLFT